MRKAPGRRAGWYAGLGRRGRAVSGEAPAPRYRIAVLALGNTAKSHGRGKSCRAKRDSDIFDRLSSPSIVLHLYVVPV